MAGCLRDNFNCRYSARRLISDPAAAWGGTKGGRHGDSDQLDGGRDLKGLGPLEATFLERINSLSVEATEDLGEALLDFHEISDLSAWLEGQVGRATA